MYGSVDTNTHRHQGRTPYFSQDKQIHRWFSRHCWRLWGRLISRGESRWVSVIWKCLLLCLWRHILVSITASSHTFACSVKVQLLSLQLFFEFFSLIEGEFLQLSALDHIPLKTTTANFQLRDERLTVLLENQLYLEFKRGAAIRSEITLCDAGYFHIG